MFPASSPRALGLPTIKCARAAKRKMQADELRTVQATEQYAACAAAAAAAAPSSSSPSSSSSSLFPLQRAYKSQRTHAKSTAASHQLSMQDLLAASSSSCKKRPASSVTDFDSEGEEMITQERADGTMGGASSISSKSKRARTHEFSSGRVSPPAVIAMLHLDRVTSGPPPACGGLECNAESSISCASPNEHWNHAHQHAAMTTMAAQNDEFRTPRSLNVVSAAAAASSSSSSSSLLPVLSLTPFVPANESAVAASSDASAAAAAAAASAVATESVAAAAAPVIGSDCHMLRAFSRDQDSWFTLLHTKLNLADLAALYSTSRTCRAWIGQPSKMLLASKRARVVSPKALVSMAQCAWVRPFLMQVKVNMRPALPAAAAAAAAAATGTAAAAASTSAVTTNSTVVTPLTTAVVPAAAAAVGAGVVAAAAGAPAATPLVSPPLVSTLPAVIDSLSCFPRLTRVGLQLCSMDAGRAEIREGFQKLTGAGLRIQHLELLMAGVGTMPTPEQIAQASRAGQPIVPMVAATFLELEHLPHLESLAVSNLDELPSGLNFEALPKLNGLKQLGITISRGPSAGGAPSVHRSFHATAAQSKCLAQCKQLINLRCGVWSLPMHLDQQLLMAPAAGAAVVAEVQQKCKAVLDAGVGTLMAGKISALRTAQKELLALRAAPGYSASSSPDPVPSALPLQLLHLEGTVISSAVWTHLSQMHSLLSLTPYAWRSDLTPAQWALLSKFRHLRSFSLLTHPLDAYGDSPITADQFLPHLLQCTMIQTLHLQSVRLSRDQLHQIVTRLPNLKHLSLRAMEVESVQPLALANKLQVLSMHFCTQPAASASASASSASTSVASSPSLSLTSEADTAAAASVLAPESRVLSFRESLPAMPQLTALLLHDRVRITAEAAAPLNAALVRRLPKLKLAAFHQNLLTTPATPASSTAVASSAVSVIDAPAAADAPAISS